MSMGRILRALARATVVLVSGLAHAAAIQVARSTQLRLDAAIHGNRALLYVVRRADQAPIDGAGRITAEINGHALPLRPEGTGYAFSLAGLPAGPQRLQVVVAHNGIRELLTGRITLPKRTGSGAFALLERHGYGAWWILNIVVLLLAARLIMRRKTPPPESR